MGRLVCTVGIPLLAMALLSCKEVEQPPEVREASPGIAEEPVPTVELATPTMTLHLNGKSAADARVITDKLSYHPGEAILVTIRNNLAVTIYAPSRGRCSVVSVQRFEARQWVVQDGCPTKNVHVFEFPPDSDLTRALRPATEEVESQDTIVIGPVAPAESTAAVREQPTVTPWEPGDPVPVIPEGAIAPPFTGLESDLGPGTYRIEFAFTLDSHSGPTQTVYSDVFTVLD